MRRAFASLGAGDLAKAAAALFWLGRAARIHRARSAPDLLMRLRAPAPARPRSLSRREAERMRWALLAVAKRVPWRADCMVQALAARLWLDRLQAPCTFRLAVRRGPEGLLAHAWIEVDDLILTGGQALDGLVDFLAADRRPS